MTWKSWKRSASVAWPVKLGVACLALGALAIAADASATTFYKWTDADGNVHYSDKPPKGFSGVVTPVEVDADAHTVPLAPPPETAPAAPVSQAPDLLTQRRETRARLEHNLAAARERLDLARKALAEFSGSGEDQQYVQRQVDASALNPNQPAQGVDLSQPQSIPNPDATQSAPARGGMFGMAPRSNCRQVKNKDGRTALVCPTAVPNQEYYRRLQELEDEVKRAEQAVADAEVAYRKGVD